jgi:hypothetical protein
MGVDFCAFCIGPKILEIQNLPLLSSYGSGPKMVYIVYYIVCTVLSVDLYSSSLVRFC